MMSNIMEANCREVHAIEFLAGLDGQLSNNEQHLTPRLKSIPNAYRDYRLARKKIESVLDSVYASLPIKTLLHMRRLCQCSEVIIRPKPVVKRPSDVQIVPTDALKVLINKALGSECAICLRDRVGIKKCEMRKAMNLIAPPIDQKRDGTCPYRDVVTACELENYI